MNRRLWVGLLTLSGCFSPTGEVCMEDRDCATGSTCVAGRCVSPDGGSVGGGTAGGSTAGGGSIAGGVAGGNAGGQIAGGTAGGQIAGGTAGGQIAGGTAGGQGGGFTPVGGGQIAGGTAGGQIAGGTAGGQGGGFTPVGGGTVAGGQGGGFTPVGGGTVAGGMAGGQGGFGGGFTPVGGGAFAGGQAGGFAPVGGGNFAGGQAGGFAPVGGGNFAGGSTPVGGGNFGGGFTPVGGGNFGGGFTPVGGGNFAGGSTPVGGGNFGGGFTPVGGGNFGGGFTPVGGGNFGGGFTPVGGGNFAGGSTPVGGGNFGGGFTPVGGGNFGGGFTPVGGGNFAGGFTPVGGGVAGGTTVPGDLCGAPILVATGTVTLNGSNLGANANYGQNAGVGCAFAEGPDVVYQVTIPALTRLSVRAASSTVDLVVNVVADAASCGSPSPMTCLANSDVPGIGTEQVSISTGGAPRTVLLVVHGYSPFEVGQFTLAFTTQLIQPGETCDAPVAITPSQLVGHSLAGYSSDYDTSFTGACEFKAGADRVYSIMVPPGQRLTTLLAPTAGLDVAVSLVRGSASCSMNVCVAGVNDGFSGTPENAFWDNLGTVPAELLIVVDQVSGGGTYNMLVHLSPSPPFIQGGPTCQAATPLALDAGAVLSTTSGRASNFAFQFNNPGCAQTSDGPDSVFSVTIPPSSVVRATVAPSGWDAVLNVTNSIANCGQSFDGGITFGATCSHSSDNFSAPEQVSIRNTTTSPTVAYLIVDSQSSFESGTFSISADVQPITALVGDTCQMPQPILMSGVQQGLTTSGYFNDLSPANSCTGYPNPAPDRIFSFEIPAGKQLTAVVIPNGWDPSLYIVDPMSCVNAQSCLVGSDTGANNGSESVRFTNTGTASRTVFLVVDGFASSESGTFDLFTALSP